MSRLLSLLPLLLTLLITQQASAELHPFHARYSLSGVLPFELKATRTLTRKGDLWLLTNSASAPFSTLNERSLFRATTDINQSVITQPLEYNFQRKVFSKTKSEQILFDWQINQATLKHGSDQKLSDLIVASFDPLLYQLQLQLDLQQQNSQLNYSILSSKGAKEYHFKVIEQNIMLELPIGLTETTLVERDNPNNQDRKTRIWLAPKLNYQIVKLEHLDGDQRYQLLLEAFENK